MALRTIFITLIPAVKKILAFGIIGLQQFKYCTSPQKIDLLRVLIDIFYNYAALAYLQQTSAAQNNVPSSNALFSLYSGMSGKSGVYLNRLIRWGVMKC